MGEWSKVPNEIKSELETLGLSIGGTIGDGKIVYTVLTSWFPQKGNKKLIGLLELQGWVKDEGRVTSGSKYLKYRKQIKERFRQEEMNL